MHSRVILSCVVAFCVSGVPAAQAQSPSWGELSVSPARIDYDLGGVGRLLGVGELNGIAIRMTRALTSNVNIELRSLFARPRHEFGGGSGTLFMPEAQLQYHWTVGRLEPFVGAGLGTTALSSSGLTNWYPTASAAGGTAVRLTDRFAVTSEVRVHGHGWRFTGATGEFSAGVAWRLPSL